MKSLKPVAILAALATFAPLSSRADTVMTLPAPVVLRAPSAPARGATAADNSRFVPQGEFAGVVHTFAERSSLLDQVTRERYLEAKALNTARGTGTRIVFKKAKF